MLKKLKLRIAIQKSGKLSKESKKLLEQCGIKINSQKYNLLTFSENMPIDIMQVRDNDIPGLIINGLVDLGIIGENVLEEEILNLKNKGEKPRYDILHKLDFGECRLSIALPSNKPWKNIKCLNGKRIATSYPNLLKRYLDRLNINSKLYLLQGSVEIATRIGIADAICDLVSTGSTLIANGLKEVEIIYSSKACLIQKYSKFSIKKKILINKLLVRIKGIIQARKLNYIIMYAPIKKLNQILNLLPKIKSPIILPLNNNIKKVVIINIIKKNISFWETIENLKLFGASSILILPIKKIME